jgi:hypothetical protein
VEPRERKRKIKTLWGLVFIGFVYGCLINFHLPLIGSPELDGILGVLFGLFACAHPAANLLDVILYSKYFTFSYFTRRSTALFWGLNILVLLVGWVDIVSGLQRFSYLK